jgi:hypothetical protein
MVCKGEKGASSGDGAFLSRWGEDHLAGNTVIPVGAIVVDFWLPSLTKSDVTRLDVLIPEEQLV